MFFRAISRSAETRLKVLHFVVWNEIKSKIPDFHKPEFLRQIYSRLKEKLRNQIFYFIINFIIFIT